MVVKNDNKRYLKMQYPDESCPFITVKGRSRRVTVLCENALVVLTKGLSNKSLGAIINGIITFPNGHKDDIHGYVIFIKGKSIVIKLLKSIKIQRINEQQLWVRKKYPNFDMRVK